MINQYELLELFENEPKIIGEKEAEMYEYYREDVYGFTFKFYLFLYDEYCSISLWYKNFVNPIFDIGFDKIDKIKCKQNKLVIQQTGNLNNVVIYFKPTYTFVFEKRLD